jgi:hypothetical protein
MLQDVQMEGNPVEGGSFADIWRGKWGGQIVAIKAMRIFSHFGDKNLQQVPYCIVPSYTFFLTDSCRYFRGKQSYGDN